MIKKIGNWLMVVFSLLLLVAYLIHTEGLDTILKVFKEIDYRWLFLGLLTTFACWLADSVILFIMGRSYGSPLSFPTTFRCARVGVMFGLITPLQSGMAPVQMVMLTKGGMRSGDVATVLLYKNILVLLATTVIIGGLLFYKRIWVATLHPLLFMVILVSLIVSLAYLLLLFGAAKAQRLVTKIALACAVLLVKLHLIKHGDSLRQRITQEIAQMNRNFNALRLYSWKTLGLTLLSMFQMVMFCSSTYFIYRSFGLCEHGYMTVLAGQFFVFAIQSVIPIPGGLGVADGGFYLILNYIFGSRNINFALILWRLFSFYLPIFVGIVMLFSQRRKQKADSENPLE